MPKFYKVTLYDGTEESGEYYFEMIEKIIVKKTAFSTTELLTGCPLDVIPTKDSSWINKGQIRKYGHHPVVIADQFVNKNLATLYDLNNYVDSYETSEWKIIYEEMKLLTKSQKRKIQSQAKELYKSIKSKG